MSLTAPNGFTVVDTVFGETAPRSAQIGGNVNATVESARQHFHDYFGAVPGYIELLAAEAPRALEGYVYRAAPWPPA